MQLLTKEIEAILPALYATEHSLATEKFAVVKFFTPDSNWTWYAFEGDRQENGDMLFFGVVDGHEREIGYFSLRELESVKGPMGLKIERDLYYRTQSMSDLGY